MTKEEKFSQINFKSNASSTIAINLENNALISDLKIFYNNTNENIGGTLLKLEGSKEARVNNVDCEMKRAAIGDKGSSTAVIWASEKAVVNIDGNNRLTASGYYVSGTWARNGGIINFLNGSVTDIILPDPEKISGNNGGYGIYTWADATTNISEGSIINIKSNARGGIALLNKSTVNIKGVVNMDMYHFDEDYRNHPIELWNYQQYDNNQLNIFSSAVLNIKTTSDIWLYNSAYTGDKAPSIVNIASGAIINGYYDNREYSFISTGYNYINDTKTAKNLLFTTSETEAGFKKTQNTSPINWNKIVEDKPEEEKPDSTQYMKIINQYDALIKDARYKGINLLQPERLTVKFNEDNTAALEVQGRDMSSKALGFTTFEWQTQGDINASIEELTSAINAIRSYSSELGNNYNIITTRQDFTESLVNVLTEGADKLTLADMNEESANMLALQTRQQLAINSLSLASQASQSILKLF